MSEQERIEREVAHIVALIKANQYDEAEALYDADHRVADAVWQYLSDRGGTTTRMLFDQIAQL